MPWQLIQRVPTPTLGVASIVSEGLWVFRGSEHLYSWHIGSDQLTWNVAFGEEESGHQFLILASDLVVVASFNAQDYQTSFFGVHLRTGEVRWKHLQAFRPLSGAGSSPIAYDGKFVIALGNNPEKRYCMLRIDASTGDLQQPCSLEYRFDTVVCEEGLTFIGGLQGLFAVDDGKLNRVLEDEVLELQINHGRILAHTLRSLRHSLMLLDTRGRVRGCLDFEGDVGLLNLFPGTRPGDVLIMPRNRPGISLCSMSVNTTRWTSGAAEGLKGRLGVCSKGIVLLSADKNENEAYLYAYDETTGMLMDSPNKERIFIARIHSRDDIFLTSFLRHMDIYRWIQD